MLLLLYSRIRKKRLKKLSTFIVIQTKKSNFTDKIPGTRGIFDNIPIAIIICFCNLKKKC